MRGLPWKQIYSLILKGFLLLGGALPAHADDALWVPPLSLLPSQTSVDFQEVQSWVIALSEGSPKELLKKSPVSVLKGPDGLWVILSKHRIARAAAELGIDKVRVEIKKDWSKLSASEFWAKLERKGLLKSPKNLLPKTILELENSGYPIYSISQLRPTQLTAGFEEVDAKVAKFGSFSKKDFNDYISKKPILVVLGPKGQPYIIDHHHFALVLLRLGHHQAPVKIAADFSTLSQEDFQAELLRRKWCYLFDENDQPRTFAELPETVEGLHDYRYRSAVWFLIQEGRLTKDPTPFSEFREATRLKDQGLAFESPGPDGMETFLSKARPLFGLPTECEQSLKTQK